MRQPDIEIYLREEHLDAFTTWLDGEIGHLELQGWVGLNRHGKLNYEGTVIPVMIVRKAAGKWASIWFDSDSTPWETDVECARAVSRGLEQEVRCSVGSWSEEDGEADADRWLKVNAEGEEEFTWAI